MADISLDLDPAAIGEPGYGDLLLVNGTLVLTNDADPSGSDPVIQQCIQKMNFFLGEWFMDLTDGTPWFQMILTKQATQELVNTILSDRVLSVPGVSTLREFSTNVDRSARILSVNFTIQTIAGQIRRATVPLSLSIGSN